MSDNNLMEQLKELERMFDHMARDCRTILEVVEATNEVVKAANELPAAGEEMRQK